MAISKCLILSKKDCFASLEGRTPECRARRERGPACNDDSFGLSKCHCARTLIFFTLTAEILWIHGSYRFTGNIQIGVGRYGWEVWVGHTLFD